MHVSVVASRLDGAILSLAAYATKSHTTLTARAQRSLKLAYWSTVRAGSVCSTRDTGVVTTPIRSEPLPAEGPVRHRLRFHR